MQCIRQHIKTGTKAEYLNFVKQDNRPKNSFYYGKLLLLRAQVNQRVATKTQTLTF